MVVSSNEAIREVLIHKQNDFSDRPPSLRAEMMLEGHDIFFSNNSAKWRYKKKHLMQALKQHGDGLKHLEAMTLKFGHEMLKEMENHQRNPLEPNELFRSTIGSIIMVLTYGYSTTDDVKKCIDLDSRSQALLVPSGPGILLDICPALRFVLPQLKTLFDDVIKFRKDVENTFRTFTSIRKLNMHNSNSQIFIDHFLNLIDESSNSKDSKKITLEEEDVVFVGVDVVMAGLGTTMTLLTNLLGILVNHPNIQDKAYAQIKEIIDDKPPSIEDRANIPYVEAIIIEVLRYTSFFSLLIPHYSSCSSKIGGYFIPEGTLIFNNVWHLQHDEEFWEEPWAFNPMRFIEDGKVVAADHEKKQRVLSFGAGRRQCPGEVFARNRLFILVTMMLQRFKFVPAKGHPCPQHDPRDYDVSLINIIKPYYVNTQPR